MAVLDPKAAATGAPIRRGGGKSAWARVAVFSARRLLSIFFAIVVAVYLTIVIANLGGHMDTIRINLIREAYEKGVPRVTRDFSPEQRRQFIEELVQLELAELKLDTPFWIRSVTYLGNGLTLNLGRAERLVSDTGSNRIKDILVGRLAPTLLLNGTVFLLTFFIALFVGLGLSRRYGQFIDRVVVALAPTSAAPPWFYGIFLILIFAAALQLLPFGGMVDAPPPQDKWAYGLSVLRHLILPVGAALLSNVFLSIYGNRTFFLIFSHEDYVDTAKAKGLPERTIARRHILRPTLPAVITNFLLAIITLWEGSVFLEQVFNYPGLGRLMLQASTIPDTPVIVAATIVYSYLLAITVFVLDFVYALVDPRVKVEQEAGP